MQAELLMKTARSAVIRINDGGLFNTASKYKILINNLPFCETDKVVTNIFGLKPETGYTVTVKNESQSCEILFVTEYEAYTLNVRDFGAKGDGISDDTVFIQSAIYACPEKSRVLVPKGTYRVTSLFLKSRVNIEIEKDAVILAENDRTSFPIYPGIIESYDEKAELNLGTWEGNPLKMFSGIFTGVDVSDIVIYGEGLINGNASHENWWYNEKVMRTAFRPRLIFLNRCTNVKVHGLSFCDSPTWVIHPYFSQKLEFYGLSINNPSNSPNTDGLNPESCKDVIISGVHFSLGDDCIAVKSGKIYMGKKYKTPCENITVQNCLMENGHGAVTVGSEMAAGVKNLVVESCMFKNTDRGLRVKTRRGRGKDAVLDDIIFRNIKMIDVMTPFVVNCFYFCDPDGRTEYVQTKEALPVDERTPLIKRLDFEDISCDNCHVAAAFFYGLPEQKIELIEMRNIKINFSPDAKSGVPAMLNGVDACVKKGVFAGNIKKLVLENVSISGQDGDEIQKAGVDTVEIR